MTAQWREDAALAVNRDPCLQGSIHGRGSVLHPKPSLIKPSLPYSFSCCLSFFSRSFTCLMSSAVSRMISWFYGTCHIGSTVCFRSLSVGIHGKSGGMALSGIAPRDSRHCHQMSSYSLLQRTRYCHKCRLTFPEISNNILLIPQK